MNTVHVPTTLHDVPCLICGRIGNKPMCYRGEPWCCNRHRQQVERGERTALRADDPKE